jgi:hypothetical protein
MLQTWNLRRSRTSSAWLMTQISCEILRGEGQWKETFSKWLNQGIQRHNYKHTCTSLSLSLNALHLSIKTKVEAVDIEEEKSYPGYVK